MKNFKSECLNLLRQIAFKEITSLEFYGKFQNLIHRPLSVYGFKLEINFLASSQDKETTKFNKLVVEIINLCDSYKKIFESDCSKEELHSFEKNFVNNVTEIYLEMRRDEPFQ